jgi:hypothetical protein
VVIDDDVVLIPGGRGAITVGAGTIIAAKAVDWRE